MTFLVFTFLQKIKFIVVLMKNQIPENQTIDIINSDIPTRAVDITDHEKPVSYTHLRAHETG
jgi:hypothetical protein